MSGTPCGHPARPGQKFCAQCGAKLAPFSGASSPPATPAATTGHGLQPLPWRRNLTSTTTNAMTPSPVINSRPAPPNTAPRPAPPQPAASSPAPRRPTFGSTAQASANGAGYSPPPSLQARPPPVPFRPQPAATVPTTVSSYASSSPASVHVNGGVGGFRSNIYGGDASALGLFNSSTSSDPLYVSAPLPSARPVDEMTKEERELKKLLAQVEKEKEKVLEEQRNKQKEKKLAKEEEEYIKNKQKEYLRKMTTGQLELGPARESVYVHQKKDSAILSLELLEETGTEKHNAQSYTVYRIRVKWGDCVWTLQRRYSQFREFHQAVKWKTSVKLPYPIPKKHLLHSLDYNVIEERKAGLRQYLKGVEEQQLEFLNNEKYEQILIRFLGPFQLGDTKDHVPGKLPFKVKL